MLGFRTLGRWARGARRSIEGRWHRISFGDDSKEIVITPESALTLSANYAAINTISTDVAVLPLHVLQRSDKGGRDERRDHPAWEALAVEPNEESIPLVVKQATMGHVLSRGNGYQEIERDRAGRVLALHPMSPGTRPERDKAGKLWYIDPFKKSLPARDVLHWRGLGYDGLVGYAPVTLLRRVFELGLSAEDSALGLYRNGSTPRGVLKTTQALDKQKRQEFREEIEAIHKGRGKTNRVAVLPPGWEWQQISINPNDAQFLATRAFQVIEVARIYRLPPHKLGDFSQAHRANVEESNLDYLTTTLLGWLEMIEQECTKKLLTRDERRAGFYVEHKMTAFLRGNTSARSAFYRTMSNVGAFTINDILRFENMNPVEFGDTHFVPRNMVSLAAAQSMEQQ